MAGLESALLGGGSGAEVRPQRRCAARGLLALAAATAACATIGGAKWPDIALRAASPAGAAPATGPDATSRGGESAEPLAVDLAAFNADLGGTSAPGWTRFDGIGGISGGGATTRLLVEYDQEARDEILDFLFKPNFGAALQMLKVEIGGDAQSTDGSEASHMHTASDLNFARGYEWWLLKEAKKRNPDILTYGLPWAFPGWLSEDKSSPWTDPEKTANYTLQWMLGARREHGIEIDYLGIWNERDPSPAYTKALRRMLDEHGFTRTKIVSNDSYGEAKLCSALKADPDYLAAVDVLGFHYPDDDHKHNIWKQCAELGRPIWSSEESSSYDDMNGAACWARVIASHWVRSGMSADLMWNLVGSYFHGTNWYASSMLTAVQPWSGYYEFEQMPVVWATAHYTQFTAPGWRLAPPGSGSGELMHGGYFVTFVSPDGAHFTTVVVKISSEHAPCTRPGLEPYASRDEVVEFRFTMPPAAASAANGSPLRVWYSNFEQEEPTLFQKVEAGIEPVQVLNGLTVRLNVRQGSIFTITNLASGNKGTARVRAVSNASFPLPYSDHFSDYDRTNRYPRYLSDQMGAFEIQDAHDGQRVLRQMAEVHPIQWAGSKAGPMTIVGMKEWEDIQVNATFRLPPSAWHANDDHPPAACIGTRGDQNFRFGIIACASAESWTLAYGGPTTDGPWPPRPANGQIAAGDIPSAMRSASGWHELVLRTVDNVATLTMDGHVLVSDKTVRRGDAGFAVLGANGYFGVEFGRLTISPEGPRWSAGADDLRSRASAGTAVAVAPCTLNGLRNDKQAFEITPSWQVKHASSGLCLTTTPEMALAECEFGARAQRFQYDYTHIRNGNRPLVNPDGHLWGSANGNLAVSKTKVPNGWDTWSFHPNTFQLRDRYNWNGREGRAQCLTAAS